MSNDLILWKVQHSFRWTETLYVFKQEITKFFCNIATYIFFWLHVGFFFMKLISQYMYTFKLISIKLLKFNDHKTLRIIMKPKFDIKIYPACRCNNDPCTLNLTHST